MMKKTGEPKKETVDIMPELLTPSVYTKNKTTKMLLGKFAND